MRPLCNGIKLWAQSHLNSAVSWTWTIPGEVLSERQPEFQQCLVELLSSLGSLTQSSDAEADIYSFTWIMHGHFSDQYMQRLSKAISAGIDLRVIKHHTGSVAASDRPRINVDGRNDRWGDYAFNALACPIL
jgi:hypothetical protein